MGERRFERLIANEGAASAAPSSRFATLSLCDATYRRHLEGLPDTDIRAFGAGRPRLSRRMASR